jgi:four helix bundle protein
VTESREHRSGKQGRYKFQELRVYQLGLEYVDRVYEIAVLLPESERFNLKSQLERAATSVVLNLAEGSTGQSDAEQNRFLGLALRSYIETVACLDLIERRKYIPASALEELRALGHQVFVKLQAFRRSLDHRLSLSRPPSPVPSRHHE